MILKVNRPKVKAVVDLFFKFGRLVVRKEEVSFLIRPNYFERKTVKETLNRRLKLPRKFLIKYTRNGFHVAYKDGESVFKALKIQKKFTKLVSKKYFLLRKAKKFPLENVIVLKDLIVVKEEEDEEHVENVEKTITDSSVLNQDSELNFNLKQKYQCDICQKFLNSKQYVKIHKYVVHSKNIRWLYCIICKHKFKLKYNLKLHIRAVHLKNQPKAQCDYCGKNFKNKLHLKCHILIHTDRFKCSICGHRQRTARTLEKHIIKHQRKEVKCNICGMILKTENLLKIHQHDHPVFKFKCLYPNCGRSFKGSSHLKSHQKIHQTELVFKCTFVGCEKVYRNRETMNDHLHASHNNLTFKCLKCGKIFNSRKYFNFHLRKKHKTIGPDEKFEDFISKQKHLIAEVIALSKQNPLWYLKMSIEEILERTPNINKINSIYKCIICNKFNSFNRQTLKTHIKLRHLTTGKKFQCDYCGKKFKSKDTLRLHIFVHTDKFKCPKCNLRKENAFALKNHILTHGPSQSFKCVECNKIFKTAHSLRTHQIRKAAPKIFKCTADGCKMMFKTNNKLSIHMITHQKKRNFKCTFYRCTSTFKRKDHLQTHLKVHKK